MLIQKKAIAIKKPLILLLIYCLFTPILARSDHHDSVAREAYVPASWMNSSSYIKEGKAERRKLSNWMRHLLKIQQETIQTADAAAEKSMINNKSHWRLFYLTTEIGVLLTGSIGILSLSGNAAMRLYWSKSKHTSMNPETNQPEDADFYLTPPNTQMNLTQTEAFLEPFCEFYKAQNPQRLQNGWCHHAAKESMPYLNHAARVQDAYTYGSWQPKKIRLGLTFSASGKITPVTSTSFAIKLRLDWVVEPHQAELKEPQETSLTNAITATTRQLDRAALATESYKTSLDQIEVIYAVDVKGNAGIASITGMVEYHVFFAPSRKSAFMTELAQNETPLFIWDTDTTKGFRRSPHQLTPLHADHTSKSLDKALQIAYFFADKGRQTKPSNRGWHLEKIRTHHSIGARAGIGLVSLGVKDALRFYIRIHR